MTQSVAVESLHGVKWGACVCVRALDKSNLLWFMGKLVCMHLRHASSPRVCTQRKRWRQRANEREWLPTVGHSTSANSPGQSHKAFLSVGPPVSVDSAGWVNLLAMLLVTQLQTPKAELWLSDPEKRRDAAVSLWHRQTKEGEANCHFPRKHIWQQRKCGWAASSVWNSFSFIWYTEIKGWCHSNQSWKKHFRHHLFCLLHIFLPFQNMVPTLPTMHFSHWATSLEAIYRITCSFLWSQWRLLLPHMCSRTPRDL